MAGLKMEGLITLTSSNNTFKITSGDTQTVTVTAGDYFMGETHTEYGSLCAALFSALNTAGAACSTPRYCVSVTVSSTTHKLSIVMSGNISIPVRTGSITDNYLLKIMGFNAGEDIDAATTQTGSEMVGFSWWGDDGSDSQKNIGVETDTGGAMAKYVRTEAVNGHVVTYDLATSAIRQRNLNLTYLTSERCHGLSYGQGYDVQNYSFETEGASAQEAAQWTSDFTDGNFFPSPGTNSMRLSGTWPGSSTAKTGTYFFELGDTGENAANIAAGTYCEISQYIDLSGKSGMLMDWYGHFGATAYTFGVYIGSANVFLFTPDSNHATKDVASQFVNMSGYSGFQKVSIRLNKTATSNVALPRLTVDNIRFTSDSPHARSVNASLYAMWINAKGGKRIRLYNNASYRSGFKEYVLGDETQKQFNPERVTYALNRWNAPMQLVEYIS